MGVSRIMRQLQKRRVRAAATVVGLEETAEGSGCLAKPTNTRLQGGPSGPLFFWAKGQRNADLILVGRLKGCGRSPLHFMLP